MRKHIIALIALALIVATTKAQTTGLAPVQDVNGSKYGFKNTDNTSGAFVLPPKYDDAHYFFEGLAAVRIGDNWGFINTEGVMKIQPKYSSVSDFYEGLCDASTDVKQGDATYEMHGFINKTGVTVIPFKYYGLGGFNDAGLCDAEIKDAQGAFKWGFINKSGTMVVPAKYDSLGGASNNGYILVVTNHKIGFVNKKGVEVIHPAYDIKFGYNLNSFDKDGHAVEFQNGKMGLIDETGKVIIPFKYDYMDAFREGLAIVELDKKWGYIDPTGKEVIPLQYTQAGYFNSGQAIVTLDNGEKWTIDNTGNKLKMLSKPEIMDTTVITGEYSGKNTYISLKFDCQSNALCTFIIANDKSHKFPGVCGPIDISRLGIKKGDEVTIKVVNRKGCNVTMQPGGALGGGSGGNNNRNGKVKLKLFGR